jgi:hypothetical protein
MSKSKIVGIVALIVFATGIFLMGNAVAGEKFKGRTVIHTTKWQQVDVGDEDGHVLGVWEGREISSNSEGKPFLDGWAGRQVSICDMNTKTGLATCNGYEELTNKDGDKCYLTYTFKAGSGGSGSVVMFVKGTGKLQGIRGKATSKSYWVTADQVYVDWEAEVELPR